MKEFCNRTNVMAKEDGGEEEEDTRKNRAPPEVQPERGQKFPVQVPQMLFGLITDPVMVSILFYSKLRGNSVRLRSI